MAIGYTELDFINGVAPALNATNMNHIDEGVKACADQLDALGNSATLNVGTGAGDVAAGNAPAGAVTTHESTYAHANLPTAAGKTAADAIGAATGATTALKLANLTTAASTTQQGVALLGASGGAIKDTKMPDGATGVSGGVQDAWATADGWLTARCTLSYPAAGIIRATWASSGAGFGIYKTISNIAAKSFIFRHRENRAGNITILEFAADYTNITYLNLGSTEWSVIRHLLRADTTAVYIYSANNVAGDWLEIDWLWIGDYSYLPGSLSEEAERIADQLGDTPGVGAAATATITSNGTNVNTPASGTLTTTTSLPAADSTFKVGTKTYTWKSSLTPTEGEVLLEATVAACLTNARDAVNGTAGTLGTKHQCTANTLFTASATATILTVTAILRGTVGNGATYEIVAGAGSELTASGALATGGVDDTVTIGGKVYTFVGALSGTRVEGEVLVRSSYANSLQALSFAITRNTPTSYDYNGVAPFYNIASANPLVTSTIPVYPYNPITLTALSPGILGNSITIAKSASATTLTLSGTTLTGGIDDVGKKIIAQVENNIAGSGTRPAAAKIELTNTALIGYETTIDVASGGTFTLPAGGTWYWNVYGYGATIGSAKRGSSAGGTTLTVAGANASVGYRRVA